MGESVATPRPLRVDAARNRTRILAAAAEVFAERGLDVTLDDIAAHAGLGVGTVYRRFADREALVNALFEDRMESKLARLRAALDAPAEQAFEVFVEVIRENCEHLARDRGMRQVMLSSVYGHHEVARCRDQMNEIGTEMVERAKATGKLRADFEATDLAAIFLMIGAIADFASGVAPDLWQRYFDMLMDGLRPPAPGVPGLSAAAPMCSPALNHEDLIAAMQGWRPAALRQ
jgi:AcrR family transcriptional regulator